MATREDLAVLATSAYQFSRSEENEVSSPDGWAPPTTHNHRFGNWQHA